MNVTVFSTKPYDEVFLTQENREHGHQLAFLEARLSPQTAELARGSRAVCVFVNDQVSSETLERLSASGTTIVALRCAGFNNVDLAAADRLGVSVVRVPAYSPYAVAEHAVALILALNRKIHRAHNRVRESNFALQGLMGFDLHGSTVGVVGTGHIGKVFCRIMSGFGCTLIVSDPVVDDGLIALGARYVPLDELFRLSDIISLHCPLTPKTYHLINAEAIARMRPGVMLINTSRGALVDASALIEGLKSGTIGHVGLDVYEEEADLFFEDLSDRVVTDDVFARLTTFPNVIVTGHQAFFTRQALQNIAATTLGNLTQLEQGRPCPNIVTSQLMQKK